MADKDKAIEKAVDKTAEQTLDPGSLEAAHASLSGVIQTVEQIHDALKEDSADASSLRSFLKMLSHETGIRIHIRL